ncbi:MAG TPA: xanthine dehydrogenase family protein molybdopterin-binding subunit [Acidimicrobiia bacterium]|nr:xanthine dehydrogenase family protein molybdopterin-binding subunit [Acidimicrobiia bacterium]
MTTTLSALGGSVRRREDPALIRGLGNYVDDITPHGTAYVAFARSPYAHAKITSIDTSAAESADGVVAVYTHEDVAHLGDLIAQVVVVKGRPLLANGEVNHAGEAVAMVVAETTYQARDAADLIEVEYEPLPPVIDLKAAAADEALVHSELETNVVVTWEAGPFGDEEGMAATKQAIADAKARDDTITVSIDAINQRLIPVPIEPRSVVAEWNEGYQRFRVHSSSQVAHALMGAVKTTFGLDANQVHVTAPEVGGGFGVKLNIYNDEILTCFAAQKLGRPVKWTETRREAPVSSIQGRGWVATATVTGTKDGEILGYELDAIADMGAYEQNFTAAIPFLGLFVGSGQYKFPTHWKATCVFTNTMTTDAYRGAGRPEAAFYLERVIDAFSREIGVDPVEVRKKNFIEKFEEAVVSPIGFAIDTGDYSTNLDKLVEVADYEGLKAERDKGREEGRYLGIGVSAYCEVCGFAPTALSSLGFSWSSYGLPAGFYGTGLVRVNPDTSVTVVTGTGPSGQGHQTTWAQIVSDRLGIPVQKIRVIHGDTEESPMGIGTFGSRSLAVDGSATYDAAEKVAVKAKKIAAHLLEASAEDIELDAEGGHVAGSPESNASWDDIAAAAYLPHLLGESEIEGGLESHVIFDPPNATWPFGAHLAMVEVDVDTGDVKILSYHTVDDCGNVVNPMIVAGQVHGGVTQGIGQALFEDAVYDSDGNLLTGSLLDYPIPTAGDVPMFSLNKTVTPTTCNSLGVKGIGEAGTIGSAQTIVNAVVDALAPLGVRHIDMPLRPRRVWAAIQEARG